MTKANLNNIVGLAELLADLRLRLDDINLAHKTVIAPIEKEIELAEKTLLERLVTAGMKTSPVLADGIYFIRTHRTSYKVVDEKKAMLWGLKNNLVRLDKAGANKVLAEESIVPDGFEQVDSQGLTMKREQ